MTIDIIDTIKVIYDNKSQARCGWCNGPVEDREGFIMKSRCEYCGVGIKSPARTLFNLALMSSTVPLIALMKRFGVFPFDEKRSKTSVGSSDT